MSQNFSDEIEWLNKRISDNPSSMLFARLAERYLQLAETDHAIKICKNGLQLHGDYPTAHFILAKCFFAQKMYDEAEKQLKKVILFDPHFLMAHKLYGELMSEIGWLSSVEASYNKILEVDPLDKKTQLALKGLRNAETEEPVVEESDSFYDRSAGTTIDGDEAAIHPLHPDTETGFYEIPPDDDNEPDRETLLGSPEDVETEFTPRTFEEEESRFSEILDDIFSPYLDEEEHHEKKFHSSLKQSDSEQETPHEKPDAQEAMENPDLSSLENGLLEKYQQPDVQESILPSGMDQTLDSRDTLFKDKTFAAGLERDVTASPDENDLTLEPESPVHENDQVDPFSSPDKDNNMGPQPQTPLPGTVPYPSQAKEKDEYELPTELFSETENDDNAVHSQDGSRPMEVDDFLSFEEPDEEFLDSADIAQLKEENLEEQELDFSEFLSKLDVREIKDQADQDVSAEKRPQEIRQGPKAPPPRPSHTEKAETQEEDPMIPVESRYGDTKEKFVTPTLGEIYAAQGQYAKAINVFETLQKRHPENEWYASKLEYLRKRLADEQG